MSDMSIKVTGLEEATEAINRVEKSMQRMEGTRILIGSRLPYAFGVEEGMRRIDGRVARRAGGVHMLAGAVDDVLNDADRDITDGMKVVKAPGPWILRRMALWVRRLARANTPRVTGQLRKSIRMFTIKGL